MKNKKYSYPALAAIFLVLMIALGWVYLVYGTTIGTDISTGNLTSSGTVSGTWEGEVIAADYGGTATDTSAWTGIVRIDSGVWSTTTDDDVPESGDFGNAGDLDADGTLSTDAVQAAEIDTVGAGRSLTWNSISDVMDLDTEIYTRSFTMISEATTTYNGSIQHSLPYSILIADIMCSTADAGTTTIQLDQRNMETPNTGGIDIITGGIECGIGLNPEPEFDYEAITGYNWINLDIDSVDGVNSTGTVRINVIYTIDD